METKTNEMTGTVVDMPLTNNQLARAQSVASRWNPPVWDEERVSLARKSVTPPTASQGEFEFFIAWCRRTGLDPFIKQAFLIERWDPQTNTRRHEPMASEQGMAAKADAEPDYHGMKSGVVYVGDKFGVDEETQKITHTWSPEDRIKGGMKILGAWAHGKRDGREVEITYLTLESRLVRKKDNSITRFWSTDPAGQLRKCARADQYRRLYPNLFAGMYIDAELRNLDDVDGEVLQTSAPPRVVTQAPKAPPTPPRQQPPDSSEDLKASIAQEQARQAAAGTSDVAPAASPLPQPPSVPVTPLDEILSLIPRATKRSDLNPIASKIGKLTDPGDRARATTAYSAQAKLLSGGAR